MNKLFIFIVIILVCAYLSKGMVEGLAGSRGSLIQLATSSTNVPMAWNPHLRPVNQRGMYFYNPSWDRM